MPEKSKRPILSIPIRTRVDAIGSSASLARSALLVFAALAAPIAFRVILLFEHAMAPGVGDLRGLLSDVSVALGVAVAIGLLARAHALVGAALLLVWALLCYGNYEHVLANGANVSLLYAGYLADETFLLGSALAVTRPWLLLGVSIVTLGFGWAALRSGARVRLPTIAVSCAVAVAGTALWTAPPDALGWRQASFVAHNAQWLMRVADLPTAPTSSARGRYAPPSQRGRPPDLGGEPRFAFGDAKTNVLLVMFEGVSGAFLEPIAAANERRSIRMSMPELSRVARDHIVFTNFISHQRQTNRGEYAVLCGELPRLLSSESKMSELALRSDMGRGKRCLPAALAEAGYATVYLQAAPLTFMMKDRFMPSIGFQRTIGDEYFDTAYSRNKWGVDDRTFLDQSLQMIEELREAERPWLLTLLTAGTHHPTNIPADVLKRGGLDRRWIAFKYLDNAIGEFVDELEARGVLDDTLVLLTSDESQGLRGGLDDPQIRLSQNWGFLVAMLPGGTRSSVDTLQAQIDIALSTLDWLGLADRARGFSGRSVFRRYAQPRALAFGNTYYDRVGGVSVDGELLLCDEAMQRCRRAVTEDQRPFKSGLRPLPAGSAGERAFLRRLVSESMHISEFQSKADAEVASSVARDFLLSDASIFNIRDDVDDLQWVFGGQELSIPANSRIDVEIEVEVMGADGRVELQHALKTEETNFFVKRISNMAPGGGFHFRYSYSSAEPVEELGNYLVVTRQRGSELSLKLSQARMQIQPDSDIPDPPLVVHQFHLERLPRPGDPTDATQPR